MATSVKRAALGSYLYVFLYWLCSIVYLAFAHPLLSFMLKGLEMANSSAFITPLDNSSMPVEKT